MHFNSCTVVMDILSKRSVFSPYIVKPDLSLEERANDKILMKERWDLLQSGTPKFEIKVKRKSLFVNGELHGTVRDATYIHVNHHTESTRNSSNSHHNSNHNSRPLPQ